LLDQSKKQHPDKTGIEADFGALPRRIRVIFERCEYSVVPDGLADYFKDRWSGIRVAASSTLHREQSGRATLTAGAKLLSISTGDLANLIRDGTIVGDVQKGGSRLFGWADNDSLLKYLGSRKPLLSLSQAAAKVGLRKHHILKLKKANIINNNKEKSRVGSVNSAEIEKFICSITDKSRPVPRHFKSDDLVRIEDIPRVGSFNFVANIKAIIDGRLKVYTGHRRSSFLAHLLVEKSQLERTIKGVTVGDRSPQRILTATRASQMLCLSWGALKALRDSGFLSAVGSTKRGAIGFLESDIEEFKRKYIHAGQIKLPADAGTSSVRFYLNQRGIPSITAVVDNVKKIALWRRIDLYSIPGISLSE
jgi:hypothetical protein